MSINDGRRRSRYTGNGTWQETEANVFKDNPFFVSEGMSTDKVGTIKDFRQRINNLRAAGEVLKNGKAATLEMRKDSEGKYTI